LITIIGQIVFDLQRQIAGPVSKSDLKIKYATSRQFLQR
jgi:hypothetical protein